MAVKTPVTPAVSTQSAVDQANKAFWDDLCGSQLARTLGVTDNSPTSLKRFDDWYFEFYPYLFDYIPFKDLRGKRVLEVGLGYGTVAQRIAEEGAEYHGLDIARGPVAMVQHRLKHLGVAAEVKQGNVLECPWPSDYFDAVVAIGCLHHTGNLARAIDEVNRVLKPGGRAIFMVYNAASYRHWRGAPFETAKRILGARRKGYSGGEKMRRAYDVNSGGNAAPQTEFVTKTELAQLCSKFTNCRVVQQNIGADFVLGDRQRSVALKLFGPWLGLDLYCLAIK